MVEVLAALGFVEKEVRNIRPAHEGLAPSGMRPSAME